MKRKILTLITFILIITGCSNDKLVCTKKYKENGYSGVEEYTLKYQKNKLDHYKLTSTYVFNELYTDEEMQKEKEKTEKICEYFKEESSKNIKCNINLKNRTLTVEVSTNLENIDKDEFENIIFVPLDDLNNKKETKKMFKNAGYTCK